MKHLRFLALAVLSLALLGFGFGYGGTAQEENVFITAIHSDLKGAHSYISSNAGPNNTVWNFYVWSGTHPSLYGLSTLGLQPVPALAKDFASPLTQEGDFWVSTVELLQGVQWSDGTEITAEDVAWTFNSFLRTNPATGNAFSLDLGGNYPAWYDAEFIDRVEAVDKYTVKFYFKKKPGLARWEFGALLSPIFPKHYWEARFEEAFASEDPVKTLLAFEGQDEPSAGAFQFSRWEPGAFAEVVANPNYSFRGTITREYRDAEGKIVGYEEVLPENLGGLVRTVGTTEGVEVALELETGPFVDAVLYNLYGQQSTAALAVVAGEVDYHFNPLGYGFETLRQLEETPGVRVLRNASNGVFYLSFNLRKSPFNYVEFRRAVRCVIDKEFVANELLAGLVIPAYSPVPPGNAFWHRPLTEEEKAEACIGLTEEERIARARQLLIDAGFQFDAEKELFVADPEGNPITEMELLHPNAAYDNNRNIFGLHIVDRLQKLGFPVRDVPAGFNNIVTLVFDEQDFDMWQLGWGLGVYPDYLEAFFHSRNTAPGGNAPQGGVCSPRENELTGCQEEFDRLADQFLAEQDARKAQQIAFELQRLVFEWAAYVPTHYVQQQDAYRADRINWQGLEEFPVLDGIQAGAGYRGIVKKTASQ